MSRAWMPFYPADYIGDTLHLSTLEHGAYLLLILHYWQKDGLPTDDETLAQIARMQVKDWRKIRAKIAGFFDSEWRHNRIEKELQLAADKYQKRADAGSIGGAKRAANRKQTDSNAGSNAEAKSYQPQPQPHTSTASSEPGPPAGSDPSPLTDLKRRIVQAFVEIAEPRGRAAPIPDTSSAGVWLAHGIHPDVIVAVVRRLLNGNPDARSLSYFDKAIREEHEKRPKPAEVATVSPEVERRGHVFRGRAHFAGDWNDGWEYPKPGEAGFPADVAAELAAEFGKTNSPKETQAA